MQTVHICTKVHSLSIASCGVLAQVHDRKAFPTDLVVLSAANPEGVCYIETMNLDGETNLKIKKAAKSTWVFDNPVRTCD